MALIDELAARLSGRTRAEENTVLTDATTRTYVGTAVTDSADGSVYVSLSEDVTLPDDDDGEHGTGVEMPTTVGVSEGDEVLVTVFGGGTMKAPVVTGNPGWGDDVDTRVTEAHDLAASVESIAQEAAADVEQVRQDVADFRTDVATTYATKVEREDGDDAVKTWVTTNYTNSNDLATTYATKTLVSQTKDAIELAASQTYETQSDAAATYATKSALTVGLDGIRTEVAEDYQPKGDYATTASMNSAIQQSASSIESSVAATYETQSDAAATYATKTEVQQTASGLDTRITTATNTANSAKSAVDNLKVGGTNLMLEDGIGLWPTAYCFLRSNLSEPIESGVPYVLQLWDVDVSNSKKTAAQLGVYVYYCGANVRLGGWQGEDYFTNGHADHLTLHFTAYTDKNATNSGGNVAGNRNLSHSEVTSANPKNIQLFNSPGYVSGAVMNCTIGSWKLERGTVPTDWSPAPEDMATEADLQAEVTERQTLIRQFSGGVLAGYVGNAIAALVNAAGSFDVVQTAWTDGVPSILGTLATFGANLIRIGGKFASSGRSTAKVQFFEDNSALTDLTAEHYIDTTTEPQVSHDLALSSTVTDDELPNGTSRTVTGNVEVWEQIYNDGSTYSDEVTASLNGATTNRQYNASMGVRVIEASGGQVERTAFAVADNLRLTHGTGSQASTSDVQMRQVLCALLHPSATYTPLVGTWNTGTANAWETAGFGVVVTETGSFTDYINVANKSVGEFTALVGCTVRVSACITWVDSVAGRRSVGAFVNATRSGTRLSGGTEYSNSGLFYTGNNAKTAQLTPLILHLAAGNRLNFGKYAPANAVQSNQTYKMNWVTIEVLSVD